MRHRWKAPTATICGTELTTLQARQNATTQQPFSRSGVRFATYYCTSSGARAMHDFGAEALIEEVQ